MSEIKNILANMNALEARLQEIRAQMKREGKETLEKALAAFFEDHPQVEKIGWTQYTPYFNDGEPCTFSVGEVGILLGGDEDEDFPHEGTGRYNYGDGPDPEQPSWRASAGLCEAYRAIHPDFEQIATFVGRNEDLMEALFGDHVQVTATVRGIEVEEYSHD